MRRILAGLVLLIIGSTNAHGQVTYSDVFYRGCMPTDPLSCAVLRFWFDPSGHNFWQIDPPASFLSPEGDRIYHIRDDMCAFRFTDCVSPSPFWYHHADDCAVTYRYSGQWFGVAQITDPHGPEVIDQVSVVFSVVATPEPATMLLVGSGLAAVAAAARRRRRV